MKNTFYLDLEKALDLNKTEIIIYSVISKFSYISLPCTLSLSQYESLFRNKISKRQISRSINNLIKNKYIVNKTFRFNERYKNSYHLWVKGRECYDRPLTPEELLELNMVIENLNHQMGF